MGEPKFTPGPWEAWLIIEGNKGLAEPITKVKSEANAHLIAAAPEIYEALERSAELLKCLSYRETAAEFEELLSKARGEL